MRRISTLTAKRSVIRSFSFFFCAGSLCVVMLLAFQARATAQDYKGKTFVVMVASSPGGGTDTTARLITRSWTKYLPGNPDLIVRNKPLQVTAANQFHHRTRPNGLTAGVFCRRGGSCPGCP